MGIQPQLERAKAYIQTELEVSLDEVELKVLEWRSETMSSTLVRVGLGPDVYVWVRVHSDGLVEQVVPKDVPNSP